MRIQLSLLDPDQQPNHVEVELEPTSSTAELAQAAADLLGLEVHEVLDGLYVGDAPVDAQRPLSEYGPKLHFHIRRVCVQVHFEAEPPRKRLFPSRARWERVHAWSCREFRVAADLCANLELHADTPDGPTLNDKNRLGEFTGCKVVWLVKPGAEPNGG